jgi:hypothetical protein
MIADVSPVDLEAPVILQKGDLYHRVFAKKTVDVSQVDLAVRVILPGRGIDHQAQEVSFTLFPRLAAQTCL